MSSHDAITARLHGESVRLNGDWRITAMSADLAAYLDGDDSGMALSAWPAIGSAEQLIALMAPLRAGAPGVVMPAADGVGMLSIAAEHDERGRITTTWWQRSTVIELSSPRSADGNATQRGPEQADPFIAEVAALLSHDGIAPLRRAIAFSDAALLVDQAIPSVVKHRVELVREELLDAADLVREIVTTLRAPTQAVPGSVTALAIAAAIDARCAEYGYDAHFPAESGVSFTLAAEVIVPIFTAVAVLAAGHERRPTWTRHERQWTLEVTCPLPAATCAGLLRLGASFRDGSNRLIRPRLAYARRLAHTHGWEFAWNNQTLLVRGTCLTERSIST